MNELRLALLQCESAPGDVALNLQRLDRACQEAANEGTHLIVTPEMFLTGYNIGQSAAAALAEPPGGDRTRAVGDMARRHKIAIVFGHPERDGSGGVGNACVCVDSEGRVAGRHQKTHLFGDLDRDMFIAGKGNSRPFDLHGWKIGMLICYDVEFPENTRRLALQDADLIVVPTANMEGYDFVAQHLVPTRAYENQLFIAYANFCGQEAGIAYNGLSCVAAPDGSALAQGDRNPSLVFARLKRDTLASERERLGHLRLVREQRLNPPDAEA
jgi:predicted amidohydrolase